MARWRAGSQAPDRLASGAPRPYHGPVRRHLRALLLRLLALGWAGAVLGGCPGERDHGPPAPPPGVTCAPEAVRARAVMVSGSGAVLPLGLAVAASFSGRDELRFSDSIGSTGAILALRDRAIDVGLTGRAMRPSEADPAVAELALGRSAIAFATHVSVGAADLPIQELIALYAGARTSWPDGTPVRLLVREPGDSSMAILGAARPDLHAAMEMARRSSRAQIMFTDQEMAQALQRIPGALGPVDASAVRVTHARVRLPRIDGLEPGIETLSDGRWPFVRTLYVLTPRQPRAAVAAFAHHLTSPQVADVFRQAGILRLAPPR